MRAPLVLASASPRRQEILRLSGIEYEVATSAAEVEGPAAGGALERALTNARLKALDVAPRFPGRLIIGADTIVVLGRTVLEKPVSAAQARQMLEQLAGRQHRVTTAFVIALGGEPRVLAEECVDSAVTLRRLDAEEITQYVASGDPLDKAGAYGIQSGGGRLVAEVVGSYLNVVGLPLARLLAALSRLGWAGGIVRTDEN